MMLYLFFILHSGLRIQDYFEPTTSGHSLVNRAQSINTSRFSVTHAFKRLSFGMNSSSNHFYQAYFSGYSDSRSFDSNSPVVLFVDFVRDGKKITFKILSSWSWHDFMENNIYHAHMPSTEDYMASIIDRYYQPILGNLWRRLDRFSNTDISNIQNNHQRAVNTLTPQQQGTYWQQLIADQRQRFETALGRQKRQQEEQKINRTFRTDRDQACAWLSSYSRKTRPLAVSKYRCSQHNHIRDRAAFNLKDHMQTTMLHCQQQNTMNNQRFIHVGVQQNFLIRQLTTPDLRYFNHVPHFAPNPQANTVRRNQTPYATTHAAQSLHNPSYRPQTVSSTQHQIHQEIPASVRNNDFDVLNYNPNEPLGNLTAQRPDINDMSVTQLDDCAYSYDQKYQTKKAYWQSINQSAQSSNNDKQIARENVWHLDRAYERIKTEIQRKASEFLILTDDPYVVLEQNRPNPMPADASARDTFMGLIYAVYIPKLEEWEGHLANCRTDVLKCIARQNSARIESCKNLIYEEIHTRPESFAFQSGLKQYVIRQVTHDRQNEVKSLAERRFPRIFDQIVCIIKFIGKRPHEINDLIQQIERASQNQATTRTDARGNEGIRHFGNEATNALARKACGELRAATQSIDNTFTVNANGYRESPLGDTYKDEFFTFLDDTHLPDTCTSRTQSPVYNVARSDGRFDRHITPTIAVQMVRMNSPVILVEPGSMITASVFYRAFIQARFHDNEYSLGFLNKNKTFESMTDDNGQNPMSPNEYFIRTWHLVKQIDRNNNSSEARQNFILSIRSTFDPEYYNSDPTVPVWEKEHYEQCMFGCFMTGVYECLSTHFPNLLSKTQMDFCGEFQNHVHTQNPNLLNDPMNTGNQEAFFYQLVDFIRKPREEFLDALKFLENIQNQTILDGEDENSNPIDIIE